MLMCWRVRANAAGKRSAAFKFMAQLVSMDCEKFKISVQFVRP